MIDTHAHLEPSEAREVLDRAREAGVTRVVVVATSIAGARDALDLAGARATASTPRSASIRTTPAATTTPTASPSCASSSAHDRAVAVGETGSRLLPRLRAARRSAAAVRRPARARRRARQAGRHPHRGRPTRTRSRRSRASAGRSILHCFSSPALLEPALERGWYLSFAGNVTYPKAPELREAARRAPANRLLAETDSPYLSPQAVRGRPQRARQRDAHARGSRGGARRGRRRARTADRRQRDGRVRPVNVVPKKQLGQHFLVDENILGVIERLAELRAGRRRARDRPRARRAHGLPRGSGGARPRGRDRPRASSRISATFRGRRSTGGTHSRSTSRRSSRRPASSSRTCPTTLRRRSSSRASIASRRSSCGA